MTLTRSNIQSKVGVACNFFDPTFTMVAVSLCKFSDIPKHLQFNQSILSGYRPQFDVLQCIKSLLYLHNETGNIYTHILALVGSLLYLHRYIQLWPSDNWTIVSYFLINDYIIASLIFTFSIVYHTFMCHKGGADVYNLVLKVDVGGVWLMATFATFPFIYTTFHRYTTARAVVFIIYIIVSVFAALVIAIGNNRKYRAIAMAIQYVVRLFVLACRLSPVSEGVPSNTGYYLALEVLNGVGVIVNVLHIPERWFPGEFDYFFNGHQLMHICTMTALFVFRIALVMDLEWLNRLQYTVN